MIIIPPLTWTRQLKLNQNNCSTFATPKKKGEFKKEKKVPLMINIHMTKKLINENK